jgi:hypothetical protein
VATVVAVMPAADSASAEPLSAYSVASGLARSRPVSRCWSTWSACWWVIRTAVRPDSVSKPCENEPGSIRMLAEPSTTCRHEWPYLVIF